jgi:hypothetical protein
MDDHDADDHGEADHGHDDHGHGDGAPGGYERSTAPQSEYTGRQVGIGIAVMIVGVVVTLGVPLALLVP